MLTRQDRERLMALAEPLIHRVARRLIGHARLTSSDVDDLEQELRLGVWGRLHRYDAQRGDEGAFLKVMTDRLASKLTRGRRAAKRDIRREVSMPAVHEEVTGSHGDSFHSTEELRDLGLDVADALARLPPEWRELARLLTIGPLADAAKTPGVSRLTAKKRVRRLLQRFREDGLEAYLGKK